MGEGVPSLPVKLPAAPKVDLHRHHEASARLDQVLALSDGVSPYDWAAWARGLVQQPAGMPRLDILAASRYLTLRGASSQEREGLLAQPDTFVATVRHSLGIAAEQGARYVEIRFGGGTVLEHANVVELFREAEEAVRARHPGFLAEPLISYWPGRPDGDAVFETCLAMGRDGLAGVDFLPAPYENEADWTGARRWAERLAAGGLGITCHAGEFSAIHLEPALELPGLTRIGHGIRAVDEPDILKRIVDRGITLECCPTSNTHLGAFDDRHPLKDLIDAGVRIALGTDNPVRMSTEIGREYALAEAWGATGGQLDALTRNGIEAAFTSPVRKQQLLAGLAESAI